MEKNKFSDFEQIWFLDFEFGEDENLLPAPVCMVATEMSSGHTIRLWQDELKALKAPPFDTGSKSLFVAYFSSAEWGCFLSLNWPKPMHILDLYVEFRKLTNGQPPHFGVGLLGALTYFNLPAIAETEKESMRALAMQKDSWSAEQRLKLLDYCESDVRALISLSKAMKELTNTYALIRGNYMWASASMEHIGVPIDIQAFNHINEKWEDIKLALVETLDHHKIFDGISFRTERFSNFLRERNIAWPRLFSGQLDLTDETFRDMAKIYQDIKVIHELRKNLSQMRLHNLRVGSDGRNRTILSPFQAITSRNAPSTAKFIFGPSSWVRFLISPSKGWALAYIDWSGQELGIAAYLSKDPNMIEAYESGDPYLFFAKMANAVPKDATKTSHKEVRDIYKTVMLGVQYGMGEKSLAPRIGKSLIEAAEILRSHSKIFKIFWNWSDGALNFALIQKYIFNRFGWTMKVGADTKPRTIRNFPMQSNGAEMLRLACIRAFNEGVRICAPIHDAILIEAPDSSIDQAVDTARQAMDFASDVTLDGSILRTDVKIIRAGERLGDERGTQMWTTIKNILSSQGIRIDTLAVS